MDDEAQIIGRSCYTFAQACPRATSYVANVASTPERVIAELAELDRLTGGTGGARRVAWTDCWRRAREWLETKLAAIPAPTRVDAAGNLWAELPGARPEFLVVGSHIDSVPAGGWLDGALGVVAALEALRSRAGADLPVGLRLVDWADEEGARFGGSLFGSSAATGRLDAEHTTNLHDGEHSIAAALAANGVDISRTGDARHSLDGALGYVELHIEQGPVLESAGCPLAVVTGTAGVERHSVRFEGVAAHAGAMPMDARHDPLLAAARFVLEAREAARRRSGTATVGRLGVEPGVPTIVPAACELVLDQRAPDEIDLAAMLEEARHNSAAVAQEEGVTVSWQTRWRIAPTRFDRGLVDAALTACRSIGSEPLVMSSGALHDAASVAPLLPTVMLFVASRDGISHSPKEDTSPADLALAIRAYDALVEHALGMFA